VIALRRPATAPRTLEDADLRYRELLREAIRQRMRGRVAAHLSGGMDSTAIALLAAECAGPENGPIQVWSLVPRKAPAAWLRVAYIEMAIAARPEIQSHRIKRRRRGRFRFVRMRR